MSMLGIFDCQVIFSWRALWYCNSLLVTQQIKIRSEMDHAPASAFCKENSLVAAKNRAISCAETEFTAESKCVSFPVCYFTNANYLISRGGTDIKGRIVKTFETNPKENY